MTLKKYLNSNLHYSNSVIYHSIELDLFYKTVYMTSLLDLEGVGVLFFNLPFIP